MTPETTVLLFLGLGGLAFIGMGLWTINRTMERGLNELIKGMEEIVRALRQGDRP